MEKISGIYRIVCSANGNYYYGSSEDLHKRWTEHKWLLRNGQHTNSILQRTWNKYGELSFKCETIEFVTDVNRLFEVEGMYLKKYVGHPHCMNIALNPFSPGRGRPSHNQGKHIHSEATKAKWSAERKGKYIGSDNPFYGKKHSIETRKHLSEVRTGKSPSEETRRRISESVKRFYRQSSSETR